MHIPPATIDQDGPGIDLSDQPEGYLLNMSDPVADFEYARNAVTLVYDLTGFEQVRLVFKALEYGDEPHAPPAAPFGSDANFDGVAVSADGVNWYEIQDLRHLRSDKFTAFDLDLDDIMSGLGLSYGTAFRIRFCQYDDNPAPRDGFTIEGIRLEAVALPPFLYLTMDDNAASPTIVDSGTGLHDQTFVAPSGDPNTNAHSVPGKVNTALHFDVADFVDVGTLFDAFFAADHDFAVAFWWKSLGAGGAGYDYLVGNAIPATTAGVFWFTHIGNVYARMCCATFSHQASWTGGDDTAWHHYVAQRRGARIEMYRDGALAYSDDTAENVASVVGANFYIGKTAAGTLSSGTIDELRVYDRALYPAELKYAGRRPGESPSVIPMGSSIEEPIGMPPPSREDLTMSRWPGCHCGLPAGFPLFPKSIWEPSYSVRCALSFCAAVGRCG